MLNKTLEFVNALGIDWRLNMQLSRWNGDFFKRIVRCAKILIRKTLQRAKLTSEVLQTVLYEVEQIINNRPMRRYYYDNQESCLYLNHLSDGRALH